MADEIIMMNIYPARELPIEGVTSKVILEKMKNPNKKLVEDKDLLDTISALNVEVVLTIGAGNIDRFIQPIKEILEKKL